jgi:hypothetical protein
MLLMPSCTGSGRTPVNDPTPMSAASQQTASEILRLGMTQDEVEKALKERGLSPGVEHTNFGSASTVYIGKSAKCPPLHVVFGAKDPAGQRHVTTWSVVE